jgi:hypothetical protein
MNKWVYKIEFDNLLKVKKIKNTNKKLLKNLTILLLNITSRSIKIKKKDNYF